jgi:hypothetical protein
MRPKWKFLTLALAASATIGSNTPATACAINTPPVIANIGQADLVFVGKLETVEVLRWEGDYGGVPLPYALLSFSVSQTLKGESQPEWKILRWANVLGSNTRLDPDKSVIVAAFIGADAIQALVDAGAGGGVLAQASAYIIREPACSSAPIFDNNNENRAAATMALAQSSEE